MIGILGIFAAAVMAFLAEISAVPEDVLLVQLLTDQKREDAVQRLQRVQETVEVDLTGVWYHIEQGDVEAAESELDRLRRENMIWEPPNRVVEAIHVRNLFQGGQLREASRVLARPGADAGLVAELINLLTVRASQEASLGNWLRAWEIGALVENFGSMNWSELGWIALDLGRPNEALRYFDASMAGSYRESGLRGRVRALMALGELEHAENLAMEIGEFEVLASELAGLHSVNALISAREQKWDDAKTSANNVERLGASVWLEMAWVALESERPDLVLSFIEMLDAGDAMESLAQVDQLRVLSHEAHRLAATEGATAEKQTD